MLSAQGSLIRQRRDPRNASTENVAISVPARRRGWPESGANAWAQITSYVAGSEPSCR
jgi:hypothetical protein